PRRAVPVQGAVHGSDHPRIRRCRGPNVGEIVAAPRRRARPGGAVPVLDVAVTADCPGVARIVGPDTIDTFAHTRAEGLPTRPVPVVDFADVTHDPRLAGTWIPDADSDPRTVRRWEDRPRGAVVTRGRGPRRRPYVAGSGPR